MWIRARIISENDVLWWTSYCEEVKVIKFWRKNTKRRGLILDQATKKKKIKSWKKISCISQFHFFKMLTQPYFHSTYPQQHIHFIHFPLFFSASLHDNPADLRNPNIGPKPRGRLHSREYIYPIELDLGPDHDILLPIGKKHTDFVLDNFEMPQDIHQWEHVGGRDEDEWSGGHGKLEGRGRRRRRDVAWEIAIWQVQCFHTWLKDNLTNGGCMFAFDGVTAFVTP